MKLFKIFILAWLFLAIGQMDLLAQDTIQWDQGASNYLIDTLLNSKKVRNPKTATFLSLALPGAGQFYNRQYYKVHVVYGALAAVLYTADFNRRNYNDLKLAYENRLMDMPDPEYEIYPTTAIKNARDQYRKNMEMSYIGLGIVYLVNVADAFVSSHLSSFDVSDDLSINPKLMDINLAFNNPYPCLGLSINF
jgi:TM2 domain-containing membrane protein YozV